MITDFNFTLNIIGTEIDGFYSMCAEVFYQRFRFFGLASKKKHQHRHLVFNRQFATNPFYYFESWCIAVYTQSGPNYRNIQLVFDVLKRNKNSFLISIQVSQRYISNKKIISCDIAKPNLEPGKTLCTSYSPRGFNQNP